MLASFALMLFAAQAALPPAKSDDDAIVITATKPAVDADKQYVPLGSRIARERDGEGFQSIASNTGFQGLISNGSAGFDATGGNVPTWRRKIVTSCKASDTRISVAMACRLVPIEKAIETGDFPAADAALAKLTLPATAHSAETYALAYYRYTVAAHFGDDETRERALGDIVASGELSPTDRVAAFKSLAALALKRGDDANAILAYQKLLQSSPGEPQILANLAGLLDRNGETASAVGHMRQAVSLFRALGTNPPEEWVRFIAERS
jgi:tetratricopeptide (TPR) repeat protein